MSVVSGLSTSNGVSTLLNARREALDTSQAAPGEPARDEAARRAEGAPRGRGDRLVRRPVFEPAKGEQTAASAPQDRSADGSRHTKFMLAVQALRLDYDELNASSPKLNEMLRAAREIFMADDGIPRQVTASYPAGLSDKFKFQDVDQRSEVERVAAQDRAEAIARADAARAEAADERARAEAAEARALERARTEQPEPSGPEIAPERPAARAAEAQAQPEVPDTPDLPQRRTDLEFADESVDKPVRTDAEARVFEVPDVDVSVPPDGPALEAAERGPEPAQSAPELPSDAPAAEALDVSLPGLEPRGAAET